MEIEQTMWPTWTRLLCSQVINVVARREYFLNTARPATYSVYKHDKYWIQTLLRQLSADRTRWQRRRSPPSALPFAAETRDLSEPSSAETPATPDAEKGRTAIARLRVGLGFDTATALRRYWRQTGDRLDTERATNALQLLSMMQKLGVTAEQMKRHPSLLVVSKGWLRSRLDAVLRLPLPLTDVMPLVMLADEYLGPGMEVTSADAGKFPEHRCRLDYLEHELQSGYERLCLAILKSPMIMVIDASRVTEVTRLLLDNGISREAVLDDPYIYKHNIDLMRSRLAYLREVGLTPIRPWMLRCLQSTLNDRVERFLLFREIMSEYVDEVDYLSHRLGLPRDEVSQFEHRYANALKLSPRKMKAIVDVLLEYGYTGAQVAAQPRVLCYSTARTHERLERMRLAGLRPINPLVLCKTPQEFDRFMAASSGKSLATVADEAKLVRERLKEQRVKPKKNEGPQKRGLPAENRVEKEQSVEVR